MDQYTGIAFALSECGAKGSKTGFTITREPWLERNEQFLHASMRVIGAEALHGFVNHRHSPAFFKDAVRRGMGCWFVGVEAFGRLFVDGHQLVMTSSLNSAGPVLLV